MRATPCLTSIALAGALALAAPRASAQRQHGPTTVSAALNARDRVDGEGRHYRSRSLRLRAGDEVAIEVDSSVFDTVVRVTGPDFDETNDDAEGQGTNSRLSFTAPSAGNYQITVTSYGPGETGAYVLRIQQGPSAASAGRANAGSQREPVATEPSISDVPQSPADDSNGAALQPQGWGWDDNQHMFVPIGGTTATMPPMVAGDPNGAGAEDPNGAGIPGANDPQGGADASAAAAGTGSVYGVFIGVSDYGGSNNLDYTADDARNLASAFEHAGLIRHGNAIVLTDGQATESQVRQAFRTIGQRITVRDTFVFFFDGHGDSNEIVLRSGPMSSGGISSLLDGVRGQQLLVLDSCYSGSIASVVRGHPNRIGLFSSRANETSYVASEVRAGGWLAYFMIQAVRQRVSGRDGALHLSDLVTYVQRGYDTRVSGQQHLVVAAASRAAALWRTSARPANVAAR